MKRLDAGCSSGIVPTNQSAKVSFLSPEWAKIIVSFSRGRGLRPVQQLAIEEERILESRQHLIVSAPTNSGKSLLGYMVLIDAIRKGRRAVLLEPLRALAQQQADELAEILSELNPNVLKTEPKIRISTGDYRLAGELPSSAPPEGEITVATPERFDAILRNPTNAGWIKSIGAVVVDEAHLLADRRRGPTLELLIASMLSLEAPPRIALLSATIGEPELLREWLKPCQVVSSTVRTPLTKEVWELDDEDNPDEILANALLDVLADPSNAGIVFVYRRDAAEVLARRLSARLGLPVNGYHSGQSSSERARTRADFLAGRIRCLVATTALAMGVNLPATHVFVRDTTFFGFGKIAAPELQQILGRAGRGDRAGVGVVLTRRGDKWEGQELAHAIRENTLPPLRSSFDFSDSMGRNDASEIAAALAINAATLIAVCIGRTMSDGVNREGLATVIRNTLGARSILSRLDGALNWLIDPSRVVAYKDEVGRFRLTALGNAGVASMLPLSYFTGSGQLVRDLISLDPEAKLLSRWSAMDHLLLIALMSDRTPRLRRFSEALADQIDGWVESRPTEEKSLLFVEWVMGSAKATKADELFGSLGRIKTPACDARKESYLAMLAAIVLDERSRGVPSRDIEHRWGLSDLSGTEESWRDSALWLLSGHTAIFELRCFYHHLRETCAATDRTIRATKHALAAIRRQAFSLLEKLKYCSALGSLMRGIHDSTPAKTKPMLGIGTIRKLEAAGIATMQQVASMDLDDLLAAGIQERFARQIRTYIRKRSR